MRPLRLLARLAAILVVVAATASSARAFNGAIGYTGDLGPISARRPLCLCVYTTPELGNRIGCQIYSRNDVTYNLSLGDRDYYLIAFVDVHINERLDDDEPYEIFEGRAATPGDPINGKSARTDVDFIFGDEHLAPTPIPTETLASSPTPTPTAADTPSPPETTPTSPPGVAGDCDGDGLVTVAELVRAVGIALESLPLSSCAAADHDGDGVVRIEELIAALNVALLAG